MISPHSLAAYHSVVLSDRQFEVLRVMLDVGKPVNNRQLSVLLGWGVNRVTPRVLELRELGLVVEAVSALDPVTRRMSSFWKVANQ